MKDKNRNLLKRMKKIFQGEIARENKDIISYSKESLYKEAMLAAKMAIGRVKKRICGKVKR